PSPARGPALRARRPGRARAHRGIGLRRLHAPGHTPARRSVAPRAARAVGELTAGEHDMDFREVIETTPTCRFYRPDAVPDAVLRRVLDAARWAPTGGNRQGVRFVVVRDPARRRQLKDWYLPLWEQYASRATARPGAPMPRLLANA